MNARAYAHALLRATEGVSDEEGERIVERLLGLLPRRGHRELLPRIVREYERLARAFARRDKPVMRVARAGEGAALRSRAARHLQSWGAKDTPTEEVDETLVGGYRLEYRGNVADASYKRMLIDLYRSIVSE